MSKYHRSMGLFLLTVAVSFEANRDGSYRGLSRTKKLYLPVQIKEEINSRRLGIE